MKHNISNKNLILVGATISLFLTISFSLAYPLNEIEAVSAILISSTLILNLLAFFYFDNVIFWRAVDYPWIIVSLVAIISTIHKYEYESAASKFESAKNDITNTIRTRIEQRLDYDLDVCAREIDTSRYILGPKKNKLCRDDAIDKSNSSMKIITDLQKNGSFVDYDQIRVALGASIILSITQGYHLDDQSSDGLSDDVQLRMLYDSYANSFSTLQSTNLKWLQFASSQQSRKLILSAWGFVFSLRLAKITADVTSAFNGKKKANARDR